MVNSPTNPWRWGSVTGAQLKEAAISTPHPERSKYTEQLIARAERDDTFREQLKSDPKTAIGEELSVPIPEGLKVKVIEEAADEVILVLPAQVEPGAISDEALAGAAGGQSWQPTYDNTGC